MNYGVGDTVVCIDAGRMPDSTPFLTPLRTGEKYVAR